MISGRKLYRVDIENEEITTIPFEASFTLPARDNGNLIITNAKLFNGTGDEVLENATVEIKNGKISRISNDSFSGETESHIIDANGRFF